ncbi:MAG: cytochrome c-type biogenesis protein CcmH [Pseudomonadales bacterium]|nr:cytochrome c-type biogenesis protein CcmH [Pseudomonadales bacterium]
MKELMLAALLLMPMSGFAASIDAYPFPNEELRARYHTLIQELRCPQCLNTNIAGSDAMIAQDLRREVHRLLLEGKTDEEILDFMHDRYGDFILYKPRLTAGTFVLWFGPLILLVIGAAVIVRFVLVRRRSGTPTIEPAEQARLDELLSKK